MGLSSLLRAAARQPDREPRGLQAANEDPCLAPLLRLSEVRPSLCGTLRGIRGASPFLPAFFGSRGLVAEEIGIALASGTAMRLVAGPLVARLADRHRAWSKLLAGCAAAAAGCALLFLPAHGFWIMLTIVLAQAAMLAPLAPLSDALALSASGSVSTRPGDKGFQYGWVRGVGSAAFIAGSLLTGQAARPFGLPAAIWLNAILLGLAALCALPLPGIAEPPSSAIPEDRRGGMLRLLKLPVFRRLMLTAALVLGSHALHDGFAVISWSAAASIAEPPASSGRNRSPRRWLCSS